MDALQSKADADDDNDKLTTSYVKHIQKKIDRVSKQGDYNMVADVPHTIWNEVKAAFVLEGFTIAAVSNSSDQMSIDWSNPPLSGSNI